MKLLPTPKENKELKTRLRNLAGYKTTHGATESEAGVLNTAADTIEAMEKHICILETAIKKAQVGLLASAKPFDDAANVLLKVLPIQEVKHDKQG